MANLVGALRQDGFGVLSDIDVQATLKAKLGAGTPACRILGACNPSFAHQALQLEDKLGVVLPGNVIVRAAGTGQVEVAAVDPVESLGRGGNPSVHGIAAEVRSRRQQALDAF